MNIPVHWYIPEKVVILHAPADTSDEALWHLDAQMLHHLNTHTPPIHLIVDASQVKNPPNTKTIAGLTWPRHPHYGYTIIVGLENPFFIYLNNFVAKIFGVEARTVKTLAEAEALLRQLDPRLEV